MKKTVVIFITVVLVFLNISPFAVFAEESADPFGEIVEELDSILDDYDLGFAVDDVSELSFGELIGQIKNSLVSRLDAPLRILCAVFLVIVFSTLMKSAGSAMPSNSADIYNMVCVMTAVTVIVPQLLTIYGETLQAIEVGGSFILVFVPVFTAVSVACGGFTSAGIYHMMMLGASEFIVRLSESYLLPILSVTSALAVTGSIFPNTSLDSMVNLLKKAVTWAISITMTLFTGFVSLKCTITGKADGVTAKTAKMLVSGFVPIVGGAVSDAYSTVKGSFEVIGGTMGVAGIIAVALIMLPKILELFIYRAVMWIGSAVSDIFSADSISKLLKGIDSGLAVAQSVLVCYGVIFVICSAILMKTF
ncbi:MAG: stage III sporulation protein AE [Ruminococcus flavefaciens]|nr:stage III sporulation protein AE [Ruminococcus flavefaciens]MCM1229729.1 stage III sporulation protein AE [Ruminococcus flavefaciens]